MFPGARYNSIRLSAFKFNLFFSPLRIFNHSYISDNNWPVKTIMVEGLQFQLFKSIEIM